MDKKVIIITGSSRGLGLAMAKQFLSLGHNVVLNARSEQSLEKALNLLADYKNQIAYFAGSVARPETHQKLLQTALDRFSTVDIWINNAAIPQQYDYLVNVPDQTIIDITQINITGVMLGSKTALKYFISQNKGPYGTSMVLVAMVTQNRVW